MTTCSSKEFRCPDCNINVYSAYAENPLLWENHQGHNCLKDLLQENEKLQSFSNGGIVVENKKLEEKIGTYYKFKFPVTIEIADM